MAKREESPVEPIVLGLSVHGTRASARPPSNRLARTSFKTTAETGYEACPRCRPSGDGRCCGKAWCLSIGTNAREAQLPSIAKNRGRAGRSSKAIAVLWGLMVGTPLACTYDPDDPCGPNEEMYGDGLRCVCVAGAALTPTGCVMCGANEEPGAASCECVAGYRRPAGGGPCEEAPTSGPGTPCDDAAPCLDPLASHCQPSASGSGYCTTVDCAETPCVDGYGCDESVSPSVCVRAPLGQGMSCSSDADCAGTEATFCDTVESDSCLVRGCSVAPDDCFVGWSCCDLSNLGLRETICVPDGACPT